MRLITLDLASLFHFIQRLGCPYLHFFRLPQLSDVINVSKASKATSSLSSLYYLLSLLLSQLFFTRCLYSCSNLEEHFLPFRTTRTSEPRLSSTEWCSSPARIKSGNDRTLSFGSPGGSSSRLTHRILLPHSEPS